MAEETRPDGRARGTMGEVAGSTGLKVGTLHDNAASRRYFAKFERIIRHSRDIAALAPTPPGSLGASDTLQLEALENYLTRIANTFVALSFKHMMDGHVTPHVAGGFAIDRSESGFPEFDEVLRMSVEASQLDRHLDSLPMAARIKEEMLDHILLERTFPRRLQFAMSQRIYYEMLRDRPMFHAQNHPQIVWIEDDEPKRLLYLVHWAVYDSTRNLPAVYMLVVADSTKPSLTADDARWPRLQSHLLAQSLSQLKLLTIAKGIDADFPDLHPKLLRRIHIGPMYSHAYTDQRGAIGEILAEAEGEAGDDWVLRWTVETLRSKGAEIRSSGLFGSTSVELFDVDVYDPVAVDAGVTRLDEALIVPHSVYQVMADQNPSSLRRVRKYVVGPDGDVLIGA